MHFVNGGIGCHTAGQTWDQFQGTSNDEDGLQSNLIQVNTLAESVKALGFVVVGFLTMDILLHIYIYIYISPTTYYGNQETPLPVYAL